MERATFALVHTIEQLITEIRQIPATDSISCVRARDIQIQLT